MQAVAALAVTALIAAAPAAAFDSEPHGDLTVDALQAEGFGLPAAKVAWVANYFVDFYAQASNDPYSGHADKTVALAAQPIDPTEYENWPDAVRHAAAISHFDGTDRPGGFPDSAAVTAEWSRLRRATYNLVRAAKAKRSEVDLLEAIGMSLHELQDFYAHGNWVERPGDRGSDPGWSPGVEGSVPTWFDVPADRRGSVYTSGSTNHRSHGTWQQDGNLDLVSGLNKDWPGRPRYTEAYMTSYFATRQWVQAIQTWLADPDLWARARRYSQRQSEVQEDIDDNVVAVSRATGHWSGEGGPCHPGVTVDGGPSCGDAEGKGGTLLGARSAIKDYHGDHDPTIFRKAFERLVPGLILDPADVTDAMVPVASSRPLQAATRFVRLRFTRVKGIELEDPLPTDGADLYAKARIGGQDFQSAVIDDADDFSFPRPYAPFTFIRAVARDARFSAPISKITVKIHTGDVRYAGTNDDVFLRLGPGLRFPLDKSAYDDFERDDTDTYSVPIDAAALNDLNVGDLEQVRIEKSGDGAGGSWRLGGVQVVVDGKTLVDEPNVNRWLEDNHRTWQASIARDHRTGPRLPVWLNLYDEDGFVYGDDDVGDINPYDNRDAVVRAYLPGTVVTGSSTGGYTLGGRIGKGGDKAMVRYVIDTLTPTLGTGRPFVLPPGAGPVVIAPTPDPPAPPPPVATIPAPPPPVAVATVDAPPPAASRSGPR